MSSRLNICCCLLLWLFAGVAIHAEEEPLPGRFEIEIGGFFVTNVNSVVQFAREFGPLEVGTIIDFSKDLGLADSDTIPRIDGVYRFNRRHSLNFSWWDIDRSASQFLGVHIDFGNISIPLGETVEASLDTQTYRLSYAYSFYNVPKAELGVNVGLHATRIKAGIACITCMSSDLQDAETVTAPLPVFGLHFRYQMSRRWSFTGYTQHFILEYGDYEGSLTDSRFSLTHHTFKNVGFGFGWDRIEMDVDINSSDYLLTVDHKLDGIQAFVTVYAGKPRVGQ